MRPIGWLLSPLVLVLLTVAPPTGVAQETCPGKPNAHVIERIETRLADGTIKRTTRCACNDGYKSQGGACVLATTMRAAKPTVIRPQTRAECVRSAGEQLKADLQRCGPPLLECLGKQGVIGDAAGCTFGTLSSSITLLTSGAADPTKATTVAAASALGGALASCQVNAKDIAEICGPTWGTCQEGPLKAHREAVAKCPAK